MTVLFVSDLHLDGSRPQTTRLFFDFLAGPARDAEALYILGDLFETWIGDDDDDAHHQAVLSRLQDVAREVPVGVMRGNRDFLFGERFQKSTGCHLLDDHLVIDLYGTPTLLMHGDLLCTDDVAYQQFRALARSAEWQSGMLSKSLAERRRLAASVRNESTIATSMKADAIMDVNVETVADTMRRFEVRRLVHGHTHRPAIHEFELDGAPAQRVVLGDWHDRGSVLRVDEGTLALEIV